jgi:hypothetical protein
VLAEVCGRHLKCRVANFTNFVTLKQVQDRLLADTLALIADIDGMKELGSAA